MDENKFNKKKIKNHFEKSTLHKGERTAVCIRRLEYSFGIKQNKINERNIKIRNKKIIRIQQWWKMLYRVIIIQKNIRGYLIRKKVIEISNHLESKNIKTSILYGNLPPQNRRMEIERFSKKESIVLICTDAIGLGVSLPIKRIIFMEDSKFDGHSYRKLNSDEIVQIAGRAGRNKIYPVGKYLYWNNLELKPIEDIKLNNISHICIPFPIDVLHYPIDLLTTLEVWNNLSNTIELYHQNISSSIDLIKYLNYKEYSKELIFKLITCPFDIMNDELLILWRYYSLTILEDKNISVPKINRNTLIALELSYKKIELFNHMAQINNQSVNTKDILNELSIEIDKKLKDKYKK